MRRISGALPWFTDKKKSLTSDEYEKLSGHSHYGWNPTSLYLKFRHELTDEQLYWRELKIEKEYQGDVAAFITANNEDQETGQLINSALSFIKKWGVKPRDESGNLLCFPYLGDGLTNNPYYDRNYIYDDLGGGTSISLPAPDFEKKHYKNYQEMFITDPPPWSKSLPKEKQDLMLQHFKERRAYWEEQSKILNNHHKMIRINLNQTQSVLLKNLTNLIVEAKKRQRAYMPRINKKNKKRLERWLEILDLRKKGKKWPEIAEKLDQKRYLTTTPEQRKKRKSAGDKIHNEYIDEIVPFIENDWKILLGSTNWDHPEKEEF
ncbi:hypothetical protein K1X76_01380 [bacterium]|nr:hypothetical protein [bacterium]